MKKLYVGIVFGIFAMASFLAMNLYTSTQFPGYGGNETCNNCHNQPAFAKNVDVSFAMNDFAGAQAAFEANSLYSTDEVPVIPTNNRSMPIEFVRTQFLTNSTDMMVMMEIDDTTLTTPANSTTATSDKFAIIFNIDVVNFTVGDFLTNYNSSATDPNLVLQGQMAFPNGEADLWWIDTSVVNYNSTGKAYDDYITSNYVTDGSTHQDVYYSLWYGILAVHGSNVVWGYRLIFVRALTDNDPNDAQFTNGQGVYYAIATWNDEANEYHHSSFDQMVIVGNEIAAGVTSTVTVNNTIYSTITSPGSKSNTAASFTTIFALAGIVVAIPLVSRMRRKN